VAEPDVQLPGKSQHVLQTNDQEQR